MVAMLLGGDGVTCLLRNPSRHRYETPATRVDVAVAGWFYPSYGSGADWFQAAAFRLMNRERWGMDLSDDDLWLSFSGSGSRLSWLMLLPSAFESSTVTTGVDVSLVVYDDVCPNFGVYVDAVASGFPTVYGSDRCSLDFFRLKSALPLVWFWYRAVEGGTVGWYDVSSNCLAVMSSNNLTIIYDCLARMLDGRI